MNSMRPAYRSVKASPSTEKRPREARYPSLDVWRGLACLMVLVNHSTFFSPTGDLNLWDVQLGLWLRAASQRLWTGVPIFFVISGYCISATADSSRIKNDHITTYFFRRFRRIFPPYWIVVLLSAVAVGVVDYLLLPGAVTKYHHTDLLRPWWYSPWQWVGNLTLTEVWRSHIIGDHKAMFLGPAWTLCYEEQFYAVVGLILLLAPRRFFASAAAVTLLVGVVMNAAPGLGFAVDGFFFDGLWLQFAMGFWCTTNSITRIRSAIG